MSEPFTNHQISPEARTRLLDRDAVAAAYACNTLRIAARVLGTGQQSFENALDLHGIPRRKRGARPPGMVLTRAMVKRMVLRAYANSDRCPPTCPYRDCQCLEVEGKCGLLEAMG